MPKLGYGYSLYPGSPSSQPSDISGLSLWLKADAGVDTTSNSEEFVSEVTLVGAGTAGIDGTYKRNVGGRTPFYKQDGNAIYFNTAISTWVTGGLEYGNTAGDFVSWFLENNGDDPPPVGVNLKYSPITYKVNSWADQSGNGKNATSVVNPAYTASAKNGKPAITFSGAEMMTTANIFNASNPRTMFAVYYIDNNSAANTICGQTNDIDSTDGSFFLLQARSDSTNPYLATGYDDLSGTNFTNQVWKIAMADYNGTTANLYANGINVGTNTFSWNTYNGTFCIGAYFANNNIGSLQELLIGKIAEIVVYNRVLTTPERQQVEGYLNAKYAIY
jgi:hypothetical protein